MISSSKNFVISLLILLVSVFLLLSATAIYLEPLSGDLTRLGGYSENDFGWQQNQQRISESLVDYKPVKNSYDVVVFGDSFSFDDATLQTHDATYWQNFLANDTGLSIVTYDVNKIRILDVVLSEKYRNSPPRIFLFEFVERELMYLPKLLAENNLPDTCGQDIKINNRPFVTRPLGKDIISFNRSFVYAITSDDFPLIDLSYAADYLKKNFLRSVLGFDDVRSKKLALTRNDLFSSNENNQLLIIDDDFSKQGWQREDLEEAACALKTIQNLVQQNGVTFFSAMIVPDKSTAYADYLVNSKHQNMSQLGHFDAPGLNLIRVNEVIQSSIQGGEIDVYLPNDTHWGSAGHRIAANYIKEYLLKIPVAVSD